MIKTGSIQEVKAKYGSRFLKLPGVVSVGMSRDDKDEQVIVIGLDGPRPTTAKRLPRRLDGYLVRVEIVGSIKAI